MLLEIIKAKKVHKHPLSFFKTLFFLYKKRNSASNNFINANCQLDAIYKCLYMYIGFPGGSDGKESARNARDLSSIPVSGIFLGEGNVFFIAL